MKKVFTSILFFFSGCLLFGQYLPMVKENRCWIYQKYYSNDAPQIASGFLINFEGDTTLGNTDYKKIWHRELQGTHPCPPAQAPCFVFDFPYKVESISLLGYIREDIPARKVYYKPAMGTYCNENEYLLFDFSLSVNDTLDFCKKEALGAQPNFGKIDSITNNNYYQVTRKTFHSFGYQTFIGLPIIGQVNLVESIGFEKFGLFHEVNNLNELFDFCEGSLNECNVLSSASEGPENQSVMVFPNPTTGSILFKVDPSIKSIELYSYLGHKIDLDFKENSFDLTGQSDGLYIAKIITTDGKVSLVKVVKNSR